MDLYEQIKNYTPWCEQEEKDKQILLDCLKKYDNIFLRDNKLAHFTVSVWIVNKDRTKVIMAYHNIYNSWSWLGGHADGETDLLKVAVKEAAEESGAENVKVVSNDIFSLEVLTVDGHIKKGEYVSSHLHLNVTYLLEADESETLKKREGENSAVSWFLLDEAIEMSNETWVKENIYNKLNEKLRLMSSEEKS